MSTARVSTEKSEKEILWISFGAGAAFAVVEFFSAIWTHSQSVLMDAAYDASELIIIMLTLFLTPLFHEPVSEQRPYGYLQVESIFVIIKGFMMLAVTVSLSANSINLALAGGHKVNGGQISLLQLVLGLASVGVYAVMHCLNRSLSSPTVKAELLGWKLDILYSMGLSAAFFGSIFLERTPLAFIAPYFDQIMAAVVVLFTIPENIRMLWRAIRDVFLFSPEESLRDEVKAVCQEIMEDYDFEPVFYDITRTGRHLWVSVYHHVPGRILDVELLRQATVRIQNALLLHLGECSAELIVVPRGMESLPGLPEPEAESSL